MLTPPESYIGIEEAELNPEFLDFKVGTGITGGGTGRGLVVTTVFTFLFFFLDLIKRSCLGLTTLIFSARLEAVGAACSLGADISAPPAMCAEPIKSTLYTSS